jgi:SAM-dependent methyltransferase
MNIAMASRSAVRGIQATGLVLAVALLALPALTGPTAADAPIGPLGPAGLASNAFPKPIRPVAPIVSEIWSTEAARDRDGEADQVMDVLGIGPGMTIADVGAGSGYYTVRLARRVGAGGRVIAEDVVPRYLDDLQRRIERERLGNVILGLGDPHDPRLPPGAVDLVLMVHMYHEVEQPFGLLYNLLPALRAPARVAVIDLDQPTVQHGTPHALLVCEFHALGFREIQWRWLHRKGAYLAVFEPPAERPAPDQIKPCAP